MTDLIERTCALARASHEYIKQALADAGYPQIEPCHGDVFHVLFEHESVGIAQLSEKNASKQVNRIGYGYAPYQTRTCLQTRKQSRRSSSMCLSDKKGARTKADF